MNYQITLRYLATAVLLVASVGLGACSDPVLVTTQTPHRTTKWPDSLLKVAAGIPVQESGRIKPLDTWARFQLLGFSAKRNLELTIDGREEKLSALEWALDMMFYPVQAESYPVFLVEDYDVLSDVGLPTEGLRKRDRYSFEFLSKAENAIAEKAERYDALSRDKNSPVKLSAVQKQVIRLGHLMNDFRHMQLALHLGRQYVDVQNGYPSLAADFPGESQVSFAEFVLKLPELLKRYESQLPAEGDSPSQELKELSTVLGQIDGYGRFEPSFRMFPPPLGNENWFTQNEIVRRGFVSFDGIEPQLKLFSTLAAITPSKYRVVEMPEIERGLADFQKQSAALALSTDPLATSTRELVENHRQASVVDLEVSFYRGRYFMIAQWGFVTALMIACLLWMFPRSRVGYGLVWLLTAAPWIALVIGIVVRGIIRARPPVSTLYEAILFITSVGVFAALVIEGINRGRIALFLATVIGSAGMLLAGWYEEIGGIDTMPQLVAVLDTNFWLMTHVTTVTIGYAAGYLAAAIAHVYLICKLVGFKRDNPDFYRSVARMVYGAIGFCVVFSTVGTILGGVWANDSWGRFWGWDPKENGALMIVLTSLILLHARLGGYIREFGLAIGAICLGIVVTFSFFHTNQLGIGLHTYGFDEKILNLVMWTYKVEGTVLGLGMIAMFRERLGARPQSVPSKSPASTDPVGGLLAKGEPKPTR